MPHLPSTMALRAFEVAARQLNFTHTARELNLTQGAVSHQIRELETRLGVALFQRQGRGLVLSAAGERYLPFAQEALEACAEEAIKRRVPRSTGCASAAGRCKPTSPTPH